MGLTQYGQVGRRDALRMGTPKLTIRIYDAKRAVDHNAYADLLETLTHGKP